MTVTAQMVRELRDRTSAGMLDCKKALEENSGDFDKAIDWLRQKGLSKAAKKAGRTAAEGLVYSYIHGEGRIGVLLEVNSETDFVARNEAFKGFANDIAMHIAASNPMAVSENEIPAEKIEKERVVLRATNLESGKKPEMVDKIVDGQIKKWLAESCLLSQKYVKNPDITVADHLQNTIAHIGENIVIRRFVRYELGEGVEKEQKNFADEVAAQLKQ
ncbi:MAG: translation elongation factor Ts [Bdellovibrionaceae bacterium]|nr:translation elongation factor Ts [Pseudobdellovibrionaceae bacterium]